MDTKTKKIIAGLIAGGAIIAKVGTACPEKISFDGKEYCVNEDTRKAIEAQHGFGNIKFGN